MHCALHHAVLLVFCQGTVELGLLASVARHAGNAGLARDTGSVNVYVALLGLGGLRQGLESCMGTRIGPHPHPSHCSCPHPHPDPTNSFPIPTPFPLFCPSLPVPIPRTVVQMFTMLFRTAPHK